MTNALIHETSPYLLQHAHNPVDWHAWGAEAFELARRSGRPIFLSIGYSTCYWCHVMERQSFENPAIAALMNESFVCIKVDREERPDVDDIYMTAVQAMTGRGGWPMSVFLTPPGAEGGDDPGLKPFYAGTYFPPEGGHGMPSFPQVLSSLAGAWSRQRRQVIEQAREVAGAIRGHLSRSLEDGPCDAAFVQQAGNQLLRSFDAEHGGFGAAPKFPQPANLQLLIHIHRNNPNPQLWDAIALTLRRMAMGGMYDQVGGGFHRYSTDEKWLVPHFEKMLYDNGQLVETYLDAGAVREDHLDPGLYARIVRQTCDYALREMTDDSGAFWSAQDAEVDALEGGNYIWSPPEVEAALEELSEEDRNLALVMYGLNDGPNFRDPHHPDAPAKNVLHLPASFDELAAAKSTTIAALVAAKSRIDAKLLEARNKRKQPGTDDKVIVSWNGMMIASLARAGRALGENRYLEAAGRAARTILERMGDGKGGLKRTLRKGVAHTEGFLEDYAFFAHGLIELHRATQERHWLDQALVIMRQALARFGMERPAAIKPTSHQAIAQTPEAGSSLLDGSMATGSMATDSVALPPSGGYFDTLADRPDLLVRSISTHDGAVPAGSSRMIHNWIDLCELTDEAGCFERAVKDLRAMSSVLRRSGATLAHMQHALLRALEIDSASLLAGAESAGDASRRRPVEVSIEPGKPDWSAPVVDLEVALRIHREYHLNAGEPGLVGLVPTEVRLVDSPGWTMDVKYPPGEEKLYDFADRAVRVYEGKVNIKMTLQRTDPAAGLPRLALRYQVCTDRSCLEPREVDLSAMLGS